MRLFLLDLDRTIFDSNRFYVDTCAILKQRQLVEPAVLDAAISQLANPSLSLRINDLLGDNRLEPAKVLPLVKRELKSDSYLYRDVAPFLERHSQDRVVIITTGEIQFQAFKLELSPLLKRYRHEIIEERDKGAYMQERLEQRAQQLSLRGITPGEWFDELVLIDDRADTFTSLAKFKNVTLIAIQREDAKYSPSGLRIIKSLEEIK